MKYVLKLKDNGTKLNLETGKYQIDVLGGWFVRINDFRISVTNVETGKTIEAEKTHLPIQSYKKGKRAKRIMNFSISDKGIYNVHFENSESLTVMKSNLLFTRFIFTPIDNEKIEIIIE